MRRAFYVQLDGRTPQVFYIEGKELEEDLIENGVTKISDLSDYDRRYFTSEEEANNFLAEYLNVKRSLDNDVICKDRRHYGILYLRRFIVLTLMGIKKQTYRNRKYSSVKVGDHVNLYDQTYFLTVKITDIKFCNQRNLWKYSFVLP